MEATCQRTAIVSRQVTLSRLMWEVYQYRNLPFDWDTYGGKPMCDQAGQFAWKLLNNLRLLSDVPLPTIAPISTGVMLTWKREGRDTYFEVDDESVVCHADGWYGRDPTYDVGDAIELLKDRHSQGML